MNLFANNSIDYKKRAELGFWREELKKYLDWYNGKIELYGISSPSVKERVIISKDDKKNACATWNKIFQQKKYLLDLNLDANSFSGEKVLDIGAGPHPSALCFLGSEIYGMDPLMEDYKELGYPIGEYDKKCHFIKSRAEKMPFPDSFFDVVISVNAIDHVDNIEQTSHEIQRVLKAEGKFRMHVHYHKATVTEPLELDDSVFTHNFKWVDSLKKISESTKKDMGFTEANNGESYVVWSNF